jgi:hypothetical protein
MTVLGEQENVVMMAAARCRLQRLSQLRHSELAPIAEGDRTL